MATILAPAGLAQVTIPYDPAQDATDLPGKASHGSDIDSIDLDTGALSVKIPLISYPQRGGVLHLDFTLIGAVPGVVFRKLTVPFTNGKQVWQACGTTGVCAQFDATGAPGITYDAFPSLNTVFTPVNTSQHYFEGSIVEADGSTHLVGWLTATQGRTLDGSGFVVNGRAAPYTITDKNGVTTSYPSGSGTIVTADTNGNEITLATTNGALTDTIGRQFTFTAGGPGTFSLPGPNGGTETFGLNQASSTQYVVTLPSSATYTFQYTVVSFPLLNGQTTAQSTALLSKVTLPNGGTISWTYGTTPTPSPCPAGDYYFPVMSRVVNANDGTGAHTWSYSYSLSATAPGVTTVIDPAGNKSVHTYGLTSCQPYPTKTQNYDNNGILLRTVTNTYSSVTAPNITQLLNVNLTSVTTAWPNGQQSTVSYTYDRDNGFSFPFYTLLLLDASGGATFVDQGNSPAGYTSTPWTEKATDFGNPASGPLLRQISTKFMAFSSPSPSAYLANNLLVKPYTVQTLNGVGSQVALTQFNYDENNGSPSGARGNLTTEHRWLNTTGGYLVTTNVYNLNGLKVSTTDPKGNLTTFGYAGSYAGSGPTSVTNALNQTTSSAYDLNTGLLTSTTDANLKTTSYSYDISGRLDQTNYPDGGQTTRCYTDMGGLTCTKAAPPYKSVATRLATPSPTKTITNSYDGLGRVTQTLTSDTDCASGDKVDTTYNARGLVNSVSNPYCIAGESTSGLTSYTYDGLDRVTQITNPDNSTLLTSFANSGGPNTRATKVSDEGNGTQSVQRISQVDGLGRVTSVCEVAPGPFVAAGGASSPSLIGSGGTPIACGLDITGTGFLTTYTYDTLGNLLTVTQSGVTPRAFTYDSLSRLLTATNPESGSTTYKYDSDTGCTAPNSFAGDLVSKVDARNFRTCFQYDALHRLTEKLYIVPAGTPAIEATLPAIFAYDQSLITMGSQQFAISNSIGRLSLSCSVTSAGFCNGDSTANSYDAMGRVIKMWQENPVNSNNIFIAYAYDLLGNEIDRNLNNNDYTSAYNSAGRLTTFNATNFTNATNPANLLAGAHYDAAGHLISATLANGLTESWKYDNRERIQAGAVGTTCSNGTCSGSTAYGFSLTFAPNGNVLTSNDTVNGNWTYAYDAFNRLTCSNLTTNGTCATPTNGTRTFSYVYDRFGNRWQQNGPAGFIATFTGNNQASPVNNNRMDGSWDVAGNVLNDAALGNTYTYDAENRLVSVSNTVHGASTYTYNPKGQRVAKTSGGVTTDFIYDRDGHVILTNPDNPTFIEMYVAGMHLGTYDVNVAQNASIFYYDHADWLGTERARTDLSGVACEKTTSYAFGDQQAVSSSCAQQPVSPRRFTGKERDNESGLDYFEARYNSSPTGRFVSPDPSNWGVDFYNPQTWNHFSYVGNNPLSNTDPNGLWLKPTHESIIDRAFPGLSKEQRNILKASSKSVDEDQSQEGSYKHSLRSWDNDIDSPTGFYNPEYDTEDFISQNEHDAKDIQADWIASGHTGIAPAALAAFGNAAHTISDGPSPAHRGFQRVNRWTIGWHLLRETTLFGLHKKEQQESISAIQHAFFDTFGRDAGNQATLHEQVTIKIITDPNYKIPDPQ